MRSESCERLNAAEVLVRPSLLIRAKSMSTVTGSRCCDVAGAALGLFPPAACSELWSPFLPQLCYRYSTGSPAWSVTSILLQKYVEIGLGLICVAFLSSQCRWHVPPIKAKAKLLVDSVMWSWRWSSGMERRATSMDTSVWGRGKHRCLFGDLKSSFLLLKGSFSFPQSPSACSYRGASDCRVFILQHKASWGSCCRDLALYK